MSPRLARLLSAFAAGLASAASAVAAPALRLDAETFVPLHRAGSDFAWIEHAGGQLRPGTVNVLGKVTFAPSVATGLTDITDVASSLPDGATFAYALASRSGNQVRLVRPSAGHASSRLGAFALGTGLVSEIGAGNPAASRRLLVIARDNFPPAATSFDVFADFLVPKPDVVARFDVAERPVAAEPLALGATTPAAVAVLYDDAVLGTRFLRVVRFNAGMLGTTGTVTLPAASRVATGVLDTDGAAIAFIWSPGLSAVQPVLVGDPAGAANPQLRTDTAPFGVGLAQAAFLPDGQSAVLLTNVPGTRALLFSIKTGGGLSEQSEFLPPPGQRFHGWLALPAANGLLALRGPVGSTRPTAYDFHRSNGAGGWAITDSGALPSFPPAEDRRATMFFYEDNPFQNEGARLSGLADAPDWTRKSNPAVALPATLTREVFLGSATGLGAPAALPLSPPPGSAFVLANQYRPHVSVTLPGGVAAAATPALRLAPPPGHYARPVEIAASYDATAFNLRYRLAPGGVWRLYTGALALGYSGPVDFHLVNQNTGLPGPIVTATYTFDVTAVATQDTDGDGVPDYVERARGLDPAAGADTDGDGRSDLEEILDDTDPADAADFASADDRNPAFQPVGLRVLATAQDGKLRRFLPGESMQATRIDGIRLAADVSRDGNVDTDEDGVGDLEEILAGTSPLDPLSEPANGPTPAYTALRGVAPLRSTTLVPARSAYALTTASQFTRDPAPAVSPEVVALRPAPVYTPPAINFTPAGLNLLTDAAGWIAAARAAYAAYRPEPPLIVVTPLTTLRAVASEALIWRALESLGPVAAQETFTVFPARAGDAARFAPTAADLGRLADAGYPVPALIAGVDQTFATFPAQTAILNTLAVRFANEAPELAPFDLTRPAPLDGLRGLFRVDPVKRGLPPQLASLVSGPELIAASSAVDLILNRLGLARRPIGVWSLVIGEPVPGGPNRYQRADAVEVELFDAARAPLALERGLGIAPGTTFVATGYVDLPGTGGRPGMELLTLSLGAVPLSSDTDADGNLLDDDWERFYFGATGHDAFALVPGRAYSYLHYFLSGADPRAPGVPTGPAIPATLPPLRIETPPAGGLELRFAWPAGHDDRVVFTLLATDSLSTAFTPLGEVVVRREGGDLVATVAAPAAGPNSGRFFRLGLALR